MSRLGTLLRITGHVIRTHPVHPELVRGTFMCLQCQTIVRDILQQFKYSQVSVNNSATVGSCDPSTANSLYQSCVC